MLKNMHKGIEIDDENICILLYADDIVLIAKNENDLQDMLTMLNTWCVRNEMGIYVSKSNVVHFRPNSFPRSNFVFNCGDCKIEYASKYMYLGLALTEHLDYNITAKIVAQCAGRSLGLLFAKYKSFGGLSYDVYTKLYYSCVVPVITYASSVWGVRTF